MHVAVAGPPGKHQQPIELQGLDQGLDALMFGERRILLAGDADDGWDRSRYSLDDVRRLNQQCRGKESTIVKGLTLAGMTWPGIVTWDDRRTSVAGFMSTVRPMIQAHLDTHSFVHFVPHLHRWLDMPDVVSLMAPKPLLVQQCSQDGLFPLAGMKCGGR